MIFMYVLFSQLFISVLLYSTFLIFQVGLVVPLMVCWLLHTPNSTNYLLPTTYCPCLLQRTSNWRNSVGTAPTGCAHWPLSHTFSSWLNMQNLSIASLSWMTILSNIHLQKKSVSQDLHVLCWLLQFLLLLWRRFRSRNTGLPPATPGTFFKCHFWPRI